MYEEYLDGELVSRQQVVAPETEPTLDKLYARVARLEERINRAATQAAAINPNAVEDPGARSEVQKVKDALMPDEEAT